MRAERERLRTESCPIRKHLASRGSKMNNLLDMGECCAIEDPTSGYEDNCPLDATVALIEGEYKGLVLCTKHYTRLQKRGEL